MKKYFTILLAALSLASVTDAKSFKRGVSEEGFQLDGQMINLAEGVSWYYNWANTPGKGYQNTVIDFEDMEFAPMCWNGNYSADNIRAYVKAHPNTKYLLGFNEPNFTKQANMTPQVAAEKWAEVKALADELGLKLVAPALNYSPNAPYQDPTKWFDEFVALVGLDAFDYVAIHNYGGLGVMKTLAGTFHERYGKPVWVTEFCYWPGESGSVSAADQTRELIASVEWLEKTEWIYRYAWFKALKGSVNNSLVINSNGVSVKELTDLGWVYTHMSGFDPDQWHTADALIPASEYSTQNLIALGKGNHANAPKPIEISQFNAGATADYQLDVPAADTYRLTLTVSGQGEPVRFDPALKIQLVGTDGTATDLTPAVSFTLPGSDTEYKEQTFEIQLPAGHQTIRLVDANTYMPSGIRISHLKFSASAGVSDILIDSNSDTAEYYNLQGIRVANPTSGIFIRRCAGKSEKVYL